MSQDSTAIQVGDRVTWQHRAPGDKFDGYTLPSKFLTGRVRELRHVPTFGGDLYAVVETEPDGRLTMPLVSKLAKAEVTP